MQHGGFVNHVQRDHSMWNYIYFAIYLDYLDENDHNALEKYIFDQVQLYRQIMFNILFLNDVR